MQPTCDGDFSLLYDVVKKSKRKSAAAFSFLCSFFHWFKAPNESYEMSKLISCYCFLLTFMTIKASMTDSSRKIAVFSSCVFS